jgi:hypothetical protein
MAEQQVSAPGFHLGSFTDDNGETVWIEVPDDPVAFGAAITSAMQEWIDREGGRIEIRWGPGERFKSLREMTGYYRYRRAARRRGKPYRPVNRAPRPRATRPRSNKNSCTRSKSPSRSSDDDPHPPGLTSRELAARISNGAKYQTAKLLPPGITTGALRMTVLMKESAQAGHVRLTPDGRWQVTRAFLLEFGQVFADLGPILDGGAS